MNFDIHLFVLGTVEAHNCKLFKLADILVELARREKAANIKPDPDIDIYMKVIQQLRMKVI